MPVDIILKGNAHHVPKSAGRKTIIRMFIDPLKKCLAEYLEFFKTKILALPEKATLPDRSSAPRQQLECLRIQADVLIGLWT